MPKVEIGSKIRKVYPWIDELAAPQIEAMKAEIRACYANPKVYAKDADLIGQVYRKKESDIEALTKERGELHFMMLNLWCQHGLTTFALPDFDPYKVVPRTELSFQDDELQELLPHEAWLAVTKPARVVDPALLLAYFDREKCPVPKEKLVELLYVDCTPEIRPPQETPKKKDARTPGKTPPRPKKKK